MLSSIQRDALTARMTRTMSHLRWPHRLLLATCRERNRTICTTRGHCASALAYSIDLAQFQLDATVVINEPGVSKIVMKELLDDWVVPSSSQSELGSEISL